MLVEIRTHHNMKQCDDGFCTAVYSGPASDVCTCVCNANDDRQRDVFPVGGQLRDSCSC